MLGSGPRNNTWQGRLSFEQHHIFWRGSARSRKHRNHLDWSRRERRGTLMGQDYFTEDLTKFASSCSRAPSETQLTLASREKFGDFPDAVSRDTRFTPPPGAFAT